MPVLVLEPSETERLGRSPRRAAYYCGAVTSLARAIAERGSNLVCRRGPLAATMLDLVRETGATSVVWSAVYDAAGIARHGDLQSELEEAGVRASIVHDAPAVAPDETAAARSNDGGLGYRALAPYLAAWGTQPRPVVATRVRFARHSLHSEVLPSAADYAPAADAPFGRPPEAPSEARALAALDAYLAGQALTYSTARNVPAGEPTSRLSADLSFGTLAARTVLGRLGERSADPFLLTEERMSLRALERALAQRDFFLQLGWFFDERPDLALQQRMRAFPFARDHVALQAWRDGVTGYPLVDAGMRQLRATGWMHPRARLVAASFLCFDLGVDWRVGRDLWDAWLIEDDPALAAGNWQWVAGVGADLAQFPRIYNPRKQARAFDPLGRYVRRWVPELARASAAELFAAPPGDEPRQPRLPLYAAPEYPAPVVDHETAARGFLRRYAGFFET